MPPAAAQHVPPGLGTPPRTPVNRPSRKRSGHTTVLSDSIVVRVTSRPENSFIDRMIALVEGASRQKTPNEIALNVLPAALTVIFILIVVSIQPMAAYAGAPQSTTVLVALLVTLIPTTIGALLSAIGIAGMHRLVQRNVIALSGRAVEAAGDINTLLLDKTGTITHGNREAAALIPLPGIDHTRLADAASCPPSPTRPPKAGPSWPWPSATGSSRSPPRTSATRASPSSVPVPG